MLSGSIVSAKAVSTMHRKLQSSPHLRGLVNKYKPKYTVVVQPKTLRSTKLASFKVNSAFLRPAKRFYSREQRRQNRQTTTEERVDSTNKAVTSTNQGYGVQKGQEETQQAAWESPLNADVAAENYVDDYVLAHMRKVYTFLVAMSASSALGAGGALLASPALYGMLSIGGIIGGLGGIIALAFINRDKILLRQNIALGVAAAMGISIVKLLSFVTPSVVFLALAGTALIFAGFTTAALKAKSRAFLNIGGLLMGGVFVLLGAGLLQMFGPALGVSAGVMSALHSFSLWGGLGIFSVFIGYDTQRMIESAVEGDADHVSDALSLFIDVFNIFTRLLHIFGGDD